MGLFCLTAAVAGWAGGMSPQPFAAANDSTAKKEAPIPEECIVDEVIWVVGNEPILKSDVEMMRLQGQSEGMTWNGDPDCLKFTAGKVTQVMALLEDSGESNG